MILIIFFLFTLINISNAQWEQISTIGNYELRGVKFFNEYTGIVVGQNGIWRSTNSGVNWIQVLNGVNFNSLSFPDNNVGYTVGDSGKIYKTTDGGLNWNQLSSITTNILYGVHFFTANIGHVVGQNGIILRTGNGGNTWVSQNNPIQEVLNGVLMTSNSSACAVGSDSYERFLSTGNSGLNWTSTLNVGGNNLRGVSSLGQQKIVVVGTSGMIRRSTNYGGTWTQIPSGTTAILNGIYFPDTSIGFIAGNNGIILKSTNSGYNWFLQTSGTANNLNAVSFINTTIGWIVGQNGMVLRTGIPVGGIEVSGSVPNEFKLYQNFPNPFNSETKIMLELSADEDIQIELISIEGKVLDILLNQHLPSGKFFYIWHGDGYPSGVYFVRAYFSKKIYVIKLLLIK